MKYDLHIHSKYSSDGIREPEKIVKIALKRDLDGIAITDHSTVKGALKAKKYEYDQISNMIGGVVKSAVYIASPTTYAYFLFFLLIIYMLRRQKTSGEEVECRLQGTKL